MNPFTYFREKRLARKRKRLAIRMLMYSGIIRHADKTIRYGMTEKELARLLREDTV